MPLIIGLGSMGRRRIRCLQALGYTDITGFDPRADRRAACAGQYGIALLDRLDDSAFDHVFICTPPRLHAELAAAQRGRHCFIEAGTEPLPYGTPSATMLFNPLVRVLRDKLPSIGTPVNLTYHCGQYLPDWHPYEKVSDYYVADAGALEMLAFELMWLTHLFGFPSGVQSARRTATAIEGLNAPDTAAQLLSYENGLLASLMIDVVARRPVRQLIVNGTDGQLAYDLNQGVSEQMYIDETRAFMGGDYPNTLEHSNRVIALTKQT